MRNLLLFRLSHPSKEIISEKDKEMNHSFKTFSPSFFYLLFLFLYISSFLVQIRRWSFPKKLERNQSKIILSFELKIWSDIGRGKKRNKPLSHLLRFHHENTSWEFLYHSVSVINWLSKASSLTPVLSHLSPSISEIALLPYIDRGTSSSDEYIFLPKSK